MRTAQIITTAAAIGAAALTLAGCGSSQPATTMDAPISESFTVGEDIQAGTYQANHPLGGSYRCFWTLETADGQRLASSTQTATEMADRVVPLKVPGWVFTTGGCGPWTLA